MESSRLAQAGSSRCTRGIGTREDIALPSLLKPLLLQSNDYIRTVFFKYQICCFLPLVLEEATALSDPFVDDLAVHRPSDEAERVLNRLCSERYVVHHVLFLRKSKSLESFTDVA